jgi:lantibiotic biosynthesis protein
VSAAELSRALLRDAERELAANWDPFTAMDLSVAMLEAQRAGVDGFSPSSYFMNGLDGLREAPLEPWLYRGAAQIGWAAIQLHETLGLRLKNLRTIDDLILSWVDDYPSDEDAELLFGITGLGVYGLDHVSPALARRIVSGALRIIAERLELSADGSFVRPTMARVNPATASRPTDPTKPTERTERAGRTDWRAVGVAHGNAGIAAFLAAVVRSGLGFAERAQSMLHDVARWLTSVASLDSVYVFTAFPELAGTKGRSSWCYGDPGIALALRDIAAALAEPGLAQQARACAESAARAVISRPVDLAGIVDCCVCHGAAFLYYFGRRMSDMSQPGADRFAQEWYAYIRDRRHQGTLLYQGMDAMMPDASFLSGDSGVVCALTRYLHRQEAGWERLLLMR